MISRPPRRCPRSRKCKAGRPNRISQLRVAMESLRESDLDVSAAKAAFYPSITVEDDNGIQANAFALNSVRSAFPEAGVLPNLGYFLQINMNVPVWDWGSLRSKYRQAQYKQDQAKIERVKRSASEPAPSIRPIMRPRWRARL